MTGADAADPTVAYARAIDDTRDTLLRRARTLRAAGLSLLAWGAAGAVLAAVAWPVAGAVALAAVPAWAAGFLLADANTVRGWQRRRLSAWVTGSIDAGPFAQAMRADGRLPQDSLAALLALLPDAAADADARPDTARRLARDTDGPVRRAAVQFAGFVLFPIAVAAWGAGTGVGVAIGLMALGAAVGMIGPRLAGAARRAAPQQ